MLEQLDARLGRFRWYRRFVGGTWRGPDGEIELNGVTVGPVSLEWLDNVRDQNEDQRVISETLDPRA